MTFLFPSSSLDAYAPSVAGAWPAARYDPGRKTSVASTQYWTVFRKMKLQPVLVGLEAEAGVMDRLAIQVDVKTRGNFDLDPGKTFRNGFTLDRRPAFGHQGSELFRDLVSGNLGQNRHIQQAVIDQRLGTELNSAASLAPVAHRQGHDPTLPLESRSPHSPLSRHRTG